jgi:hypothetical protein
MSLINSGTIESAYSTALTIDTGANTIANSGLIEAAGTGGLLLDGAVNNTGTLTASNSTLSVSGPVTGTGVVHVYGGKVIFSSTFSEHVTFGSAGELVLGHSTTFAGTVADFSKIGTTSIDLGDISFSTAVESYSGTTTSGILTVTDGTHTANIHFTGDYTGATWELSADGGGGTLVKQPSETGVAPRAVHAMITAAASFGASPAEASWTHAAGTPRLAPLAAPHG